MNTEDPTSHITARFLSAIAHELWSPLASIKGSTTSLIDLRHELSPVELDGFLQAIDEDADRLSAMLGDLIDLAQFQIGRLSLQPAPARLADLIASALVTLREQNADRAVTVNTCDVVLQVDARRIRQVIENLIGASLTYSPGGRPMSINVVVNESKQAVIGVHDCWSVPWFEEALTILDQPSVLERFTDPCLRRQVPTLLRLVISRTVVELHGGTMWLDKRPDQDPVVYFSLPIAPRCSCALIKSCHAHYSSN